MKKVLSLVLAGFLVLGLANIVLANGMMGRRGSFRDEGRSYNRSLDLSTEQLNQMEKFEDEYYQNRRDLMEELRDKNYDFRRLYEDKGVDSGEVKLLQEEIIGLRNELARLKNQHDLNVRDLLSQEQLSEYSTGGRRMDINDCHGEGKDYSRGRGHTRGMMGY